MGSITIVDVDSNSSVIGLTVKNENGDGIYINHNEHKIILSELIVRETNASAISINNSSTDLNKIRVTNNNGNTNSLWFICKQI